MFEDITKIDSAFLKPNQANPSREYRGNNKKRQHPSKEENAPTNQEASSGYEYDSDGKPNAPTHALDIEV
jgi:hypothetical protein